MDGPVQFGALAVALLLIVAMPGSLALEESTSNEQSSDGMTTTVSLSAEAYGPSAESSDDSGYVATETDTQTSLEPGELDPAPNNGGARVSSAEDAAASEVGQADEEGVTEPAAETAPSLSVLWAAVDEVAGETYDEAWEEAAPVVGDEASAQVATQAHSTEGAAASASASAAGEQTSVTASSSDGVTATVPRATGGFSGPYHPSPYGPAPDEQAAAYGDGKHASYSLYTGPSGQATTQSDSAVPFSTEALALALATSVALGGAAASAGFFFIPGWRSALTRIVRATPLALLFSRIDKDEVLDHPTRNELYESISQNPGERVEETRRRLGLANGTMLHHLRVLCDKDLVRRVKQGGITRLYPAGPRIQPKPYLIPQRQVVLETVVTTPGLQQRDVATRVGMSERMVSYHIRQLVADDLIDVRRIGGSNFCYPAKDPSELPSLVHMAPACAVVTSRP